MNGLWFDAALATHLHVTTVLMLLSCPFLSFSIAGCVASRFLKSLEWSSALDLYDGVKYVQTARLGLVVNL